MSNKQETNLEHIAIFHASKAAKISSGSIDFNSVKYFISKAGQVQEEIYSASNDWQAMLASVEVIIMDGCSMPIDLEGFFTGVVIVAACPSQYRKNLQDSIHRYHLFIMPPVEKDEAIEIGK
jgi:hypothetical protein